MGAETMPTSQMFHTRTALAEGLKELFKQLEERLSLRSPINVYLAGGMAVHLRMERGSRCISTPTTTRRLP